MAKQPATPRPLEIPFFGTGYYTYRSQLFSPFRALGVNIVAYHDSVIDGADMELTDLMEWQQRPAFTRFCSVRLDPGEVINQFYSARALNGVLLTLFDSNQRLASFTSSGITTIFIKSAGSGQGFVSQIGDTTYYCNGKDAVRYDQIYGLGLNGISALTTTVTVSATGGWLPKTAYAVGSVLLDYNGNIQFSGASSGTSGSVLPTWSALPGSTTADGTTIKWENLGVIGTWQPGTAYTLPTVILDSNNNLQMLSVTTTANAYSSGTTYHTADVVTYGGLFWTSQGTHTGIPPNQNIAGVITTTSGGTATAVYNYNWVQTSNPVTSGAVEPVWSTVIGGAPAPVQFSVSTTVDGRSSPWLSSLNPSFHFAHSVVEGPTIIAGLSVGFNVVVTATGTVNSSGGVDTPDGRTALPPGSGSPSDYINPCVGRGGLVGAFTDSGGIIVQTISVGSYAAFTVPNGATQLQLGNNDNDWSDNSGAFSVTVDVTEGNTRTADGSMTWTNIGVGNTIVASGYSWGICIRTMDGHLSTMSNPTLNTGPLLGGSPITPSQVTGFSVTSSVVTFVCNQTYAVGEQVYIQGLTVGTYLNNIVYVVTSVTSAQFTAVTTHGDVALTSDSGTATPIIGEITGVGLTDARTLGTATISAVKLVGNLVTLTCANIFFPGNTVAISGLGGASFLNGFPLLIQTATPTEITAQFTHPDYGPSSDSGIATFAAIEIYRTADGGGLWYQTGAQVNPGAGNPWTFVDIYPDSSLNQQLVAPVAHLNDPPVGQSGSIAAPAKGGSIMAYWQGRNWMASGQFLYFDSGQDCLNGDPHQSWPPGNRFEYAGTITGLVPLDQGLIVYMADRLGVVLGGPQTLTFYPYTIMHNFGVSSPNCLFQDGQTIYCLTTQGQLYSLAVTAKVNEGHYVADFIAANFPPATSYVTFHRNGNDVGLFLGNGTNIVLRHGSNIGAWSVPYYPIGGTGAMNSVETDIGIYSLLMASPVEQQYILSRNLNSWKDFGGSYTSPFATNQVGIVVGSITLTNPGETLYPVQHVVGYFDSAGVGGIVDQPSVHILPNEISGATGVGFIPIPPDQVVPEPPTGTAPSTTLQQLRFPVNMMNSLASQYMHHLQVKILFPSTDAPHTIKALAIKGDQD